MKRFIGLLAALALSTGMVNAAPGPYPFAPPITSPITQQAYNSTGAQAMNSSCASASFQACPSGSIVGIVAQGMGNVAIQVTGTFSGTLQFESSLDCVNFTPLPLFAQGGTSSVTTTTSGGLWNGAITSIYCVQIRFTSYTSGTATVVVSVSGAGGSVSPSGGSSSTSLILPNSVFYPASGTAVFSSTSCTSVTTAAHWLTALLDYATSSEGAVVTLYNEGASPTCATNDQMLAVTPANGGPFTFAPFGLYFSSGIAIKWSAAPAVGVRVQYQ